jgi:hypothetical protein
LAISRGISKLDLTAPANAPNTKNKNCRIKKIIHTGILGNVDFS